MTTRKMGTNRRADGEGTMKVRDDGRLEMQVSLGLKPDGRRDRRSVYGDNPKEVAENARKLKEAHARGELADPGHRYETMADLYQRFERHLNAELVKGKITTDTRDYYLRAVRNHVLDSHAGTRVVDVDAELVDYWVTRKSNQVGGHLSSASCYAIAISVRKMLDVARRAQIIRGANPAREVSTPTVRNKKPVPVEDHEVEMLLKVASDGLCRTDMVTPIQVLSHTGMRRVSLLEVKWSDIDLVADQITIRRLKQRVTAEPMTIYFPIVGTLHDYLVGLGEHDPDEYLVPSLDDPYLARGRTDFSRSLIKVGQRAGVDIGSHKFRHAAATKMLANGVPGPDVCELLGWTSLRQLSRYGHATKTGSRRGAEALSRVLTP